MVLAVLVPVPLQQGACKVLTASCNQHGQLRLRFATASAQLVPTEGGPLLSWVTCECWGQPGLCHYQ
jgi:hypothetical protein